MNSKELLLSRGVPEQVVASMTEIQARDTASMVRIWDGQQMQWGRQWSWDDCPSVLKECYFS